jgi:hypothetical protein
MQKEQNKIMEQNHTSNSNKLNIMRILLLFIPFGDLAHRSFHECFNMPTDQRTFLRAFVIVNEL